MPNSGEWLEQLVAGIESTLLSPGFSVTTNVKRFDECGVQAAEFDIVIEGKVGSSSHRWLIECRDRPSEGAASGQWILSLMGRRDIDAFDKVTAVSTTGFSPEAINNARSRNIDLRTVEKIPLDSISEWFGPTKFFIIEQHGTCSGADIILDNKIDEAAVSSLVNMKPVLPLAAPSLIVPSTGTTISIEEAWRVAMSQILEQFSELEPDGEHKKMTVVANYPNPDSRYRISAGNIDIPIVQIRFSADLYVRKREISIAQITEYSKTLGDQRVAQSVLFDIELGGDTVGIAFHNLGEKGKTFITAHARSSAKKRKGG